MPGVEDFGIVPVEAMACGAPVIAIDAGGAQDSVLWRLVSPDVVPDAEVARWAEELGTFDTGAYDPGAIRTHAESFSRSHFRSAIATVVAEVTG
jgi:glycosyltransferase involved in cell wall biosynthesis